MPRNQDSGAPPNKGLVGGPASSPSGLELQQGVDEILDWIVTRLCQRGAEARREKERDGRGKRQILTWLESDKYAFEQKVQTLAAVFPCGGEPPPEFIVVGEQLWRLLFRCRAILVEGQDPARRDPFKYPISPPRNERSIQDGKRRFQGSLERRSVIPVVRKEMQRRFEIVSVAILGVARWIKDREFIVGPEPS